MPSLLDRLVPEVELTDPGRPTRKSATLAGGLSDEEAAFVASVERDILWLFNTSPALPADAEGELQHYPHAASSVLNFGLRHVFGQVVHSQDEIERKVEDALARFEPRLVVERKSFTITREGQLVEIDLEGYLRVQGSRQRLWIRTDLQTLESKLETPAHG
jgi:type VI secretion system protein ImpF